MQRIAAAIAVALLVPTVVASPAHDHEDPTRLIAEWLRTQQVSNATDAERVVADGGYPLAGKAEERFADWIQREDIAAAGDLEGAFRVMRIAHVTDMQLVDDDAPSPMRVGIFDPVFAATISGGGERPQEEYGDEIFHSMIDILNAHHLLDPFDFAIHTGDNIDNALENELMRYLDLVDGTHTTTGPLSGFTCRPDGQSTSTEDTGNDVVDACTSLPEHLVEEARGLAPDMPWYSLNGNHDTLIQGNVPPEPSFQELASGFGRHFLEGLDYVTMHFADLDPCGGGSELDDFGHGYGFAGDRLCDNDPENDAYYAFDHRGARMIVLDTVNDEVYQTNSNFAPFLPDQGTTGYDFISGLSEGALDVDQFTWLGDELEANADRPVMIFAHHTVMAFYSRQFDSACGPPGCLNDVLRDAGFIGREDLQQLLGQYPNVVGMIGGHTHEHRVTPQSVEGGASPGYWNIETSGLLDLPQETRIIELWVTADGAKGFFANDPIGHTFELAQELAATDPDHDAAAAEGRPEDQQAILWFDIASSGFEAGPEPPGAEAEPLRLGLVEPVGTVVEGTHAIRVEALNIADLPVNGLTVTMTVTDDDGPTTVPAAGIGNGTYEVSWDFVVGDFSGQFAAIDPTETYAPAGLTVLLKVEEEEGKGSPGAGVLVGGLALLAIAVAARRRQP